MRDAGFATTQFNLACAGLPAMPDAVPPEALARVRAAAASTGVTLAALSGTYNMAHPDPGVRANGLRQLEVVMEAAAALAVPLVTLCTGTRNAEDQWAYHPDNADPSAWADMAAEIAKALDLAERHVVDLGIEPEQANIVTSAADAVRLIAELGSPRLRIVLDPANLFEQADPGRGTRHRRPGRRGQRRPCRNGARQGPAPRRPLRDRRPGGRRLRGFHRPAPRQRLRRPAGDARPLRARGTRRRRLPEGSRLMPAGPLSRDDAIPRACDPATGPAVVFQHGLGGDQAQIAHRFLHGIFSDRSLQA